MTLSHSERERYERDGYLVFEGLFGFEELAAMRAESDLLVDLLVNASLALGEISPRLDVRRGLGSDAAPVLLKVQPVGDISELFTRVSRDPRLLQPMRDLLGCEPLLLEEKLNGKETLGHALEGLPLREASPHFPFHTDLHYFALDGYPEQTLSSVIAIDACTADNGPLVFVPGSHHRRDWPLRGGWPPDLADGLFDDAEQVELLCPPGTVVVFHSRLVHSSRPNRSSAPRRLMIYSHYPSTFTVARDARNGPLRAASRAHEAAYAEKLACDYSPVPVRAAAGRSYRTASRSLGADRRWRGGLDRPVVLLPELLR